MTCWDRPRYRSADDWLGDARWALAAGRVPWPPVTRDELILAADELPDLLPRWLPTAEGLRMLGLPVTFGRRPDPLPLALRERFIVTLADDPELLGALARMIGGAA